MLSHLSAASIRLLRMRGTRPTHSCFLQFIEEMDDAARKSMELDELLTSAVAEERFGEAAHLRQQACACQYSYTDYNASASNQGICSWY